ncbi:helix-turn-helix domain-containing protein [Cytobacillus firmus]|uniref:helix-turn-helix domain-containing protein n=1 Tax=Cytobacillus firmus TaxID=1399 RepID=UPI001C8E3CCF|nr:helix-turn-helix domain-containing protein [Cytobacillus firmus]MBX9976255.1 helix-turn-helix domain-containing protein [Cytobacillus firmus]
MQPNKVSTPLEAIGAEINERTPSRTRDRLEKALDSLHEEGLIGSWHYKNDIKQIQKGISSLDENTEIAGEKIREIREKFNLSLNQAAEELEISTSYLSNIESRRRSLPV